MISLCVKKKHEKQKRKKKKKIVSKKQNFSCSYTSNLLNENDKTEALFWFFSYEIGRNQGDT